MSANQWQKAHAQVARMRKQGHTDQQITTAALERGWTEEQVRRLIQRRVLQAPPSPPEAVAPPPPPSGSVPPSAAVTRPAAVTIPVVIADIGASLWLILFTVGVVALFISGELGGIGNLPTPAIMIAALLLGGLLVNLGILVVGHFLWRGANWARLTFMVLLGASALQFALGLILARIDGAVLVPPFWILFGIAVLGKLIHVLNHDDAKQFCTR